MNIKPTPSVSFSVFVCGDGHFVIGVEWCDHVEGLDGRRRRSTSSHPTKLQWTLFSFSTIPKYGPTSVCWSYLFLSWVGGLERDPHHGLWVQNQTVYSSFLFSTGIQSIISVTEHRHLMIRDSNFMILVYIWLARWDEVEVGGLNSNEQLWERQIWFL